MTTGPLVTVITPVLNRVDTIAACLVSVAAQSYPYVQHIVVDGGSTDGTLEIIRSFRRTQRYRWISEPDEGMYDAINKGLGLADGEILSYLNSDDLYLPWSVQSAVHALRETEIVYGDVVVIDGTKSSSRFSIEFYRPFNLQFYAASGIIAQPTVFWRRSLFDRIGGFATKYRLIADCDYWLRAARQGARPRHIREIMAIQIDHPETLRRERPAELESEFSQLRLDYKDVAGKPRPRLERFRYSAAWRVKLVRLYLSIKLRSRRSWPAFIGFLRQCQLEPTLGSLLLFMFPDRLRPNRKGWVDPTLFQEKVMATITRSASDGIT